MSDLVFRRVNGRIIPMKRKASSGQEKPASFKNPVSNTIAVGAGFGVSAFSGYQAGKMVKDSWKAYGRSANIRGSVKLLRRAGVPPQIIDEQIKVAAKFAITGKVLAKRGFGVLSLGLAGGGALAAMGAHGLLSKKLNDEQKLALSGAVATATTSASFVLFRKKSKLKHVAQALKNSGGIKPKDFLNVFSKVGQKKTRDTIRSYESLIKTKRFTKEEKAIKFLSKKRKKIDNPGQMKFDI